MTLYYSNFDQTFVSFLLICVGLILSYVWIWRHKESPNFAFMTAVSFFLPISSLLLFYRFVGENFLIWILPFVAIFSVKDVWEKRIYWILSLIGLIASVTDSLLPFYLLPISPWMGGFLVKVMTLIAPYRIAPNGNVLQGLSVAKIFLSLLGVLSFFFLTILTLRVIKRKDCETVAPRVDAFPGSPFSDHNKVPDTP